MAVELLKVVPAANPLGGLLPGVEVVGAANEPSRDKHDGGKSKTPQPRKNNLQAGFNPALSLITVPRPFARQIVPRPTHGPAGSVSRSRASPLPGNSLLPPNHGSETSPLLLG